MSIRQIVGELFTVLEEVQERADRIGVRLTGQLAPSPDAAEGQQGPNDESVLGDLFRLLHRLRGINGALVWAEGSIGGGPVQGLRLPQVLVPGRAG